MPVSATDDQIIVDDVVSALTGRTEETNRDIDLREQMERAASDFDKRTADAFGRALLDSLCEDPGNLRHLEALLILGLAHPDVLKRNRISLAVEGRRLAVLLERSGEVERAQGLLELLARRLPEERTIDHELAGLLRRAGNTNELVDRYLERADECVKSGKIQDAIPWLQEVLLLDRTRRDVARMIRDLRYQDAERQIRAGRRNRVIVVLLAVSTLVTAVVSREMTIKREYEALVRVNENDETTLFARHDGLKAMLDSHKVWSNVIAVAREEKQLATEIEQYELRTKRQKRQQQLEDERLHEMAEAARLRGLMHVERSQYEKALEDFKRALSMGKPGWEHRERLQADVDALERWKEEGGL